MSTFYLGYEILLIMAIWLFEKYWAHWFSLFFLNENIALLNDTLSSLPGRSKYSRIFSCPDGITPNSGLNKYSLFAPEWLSSLLENFNLKIIRKPIQKWINTLRNIHWKISLFHLTMFFNWLWQRKLWISSKDCGGRPFSTWIHVKILTMSRKTFITSNLQILLQITDY